MSEAVSSFALHVEQVSGYKFCVEFDKPNIRTYSETSLLA